MQNRRPDFFIIVAGSIIFILGIGYLLLYLFGYSFQRNISITPGAVLTKLPANSVPTIDVSFLTLAPTSTVPPKISETSEFPLDSFVQITGTGGNGLRFRESPGTNSSVNFIAAESEVFRVVAGPVESGSYNWWQLVAPYDNSRQGWAAGEYLVSITP